MGLVREYSGVFDLQCLLYDRFGPLANGRLKTRRASPSELSDFLESAKCFQDQLYVDVGHAEKGRLAGVECKGSRLRLYASHNGDPDSDQIDMVPSDSYIVMNPDPRLSFTVALDPESQVFIYPRGSFLMQGRRFQSRVLRYLSTGDSSLLKPQGIDKRFEHAITSRVREKVIGGLHYEGAEFDEVQLESSAPGGDYKRPHDRVDTSFPIVYFLVKGVAPERFGCLASEAAVLFNRFLPFPHWFDSHITNDKLLKIAAMFEYPK